uniref:Chromo domain-containing protein n=1 Tax=Ditylenchus dipsaci TaxID=166011 RepID=A0A915ELR0_9BILA
MAKAANSTTATTSASSSQPSKNSNRTSMNNNGTGILFVEKILNKRNIRGSVHYLIKWLGYEESKDNTWEPAENLNCKDLIDAFEANYNEDDDNVNDIIETSSTEDIGEHSPATSVKENQEPRNSQKRPTPSKQTAKRSKPFKTSSQKTPEAKSATPKTTTLKVTTPKWDSNGQRLYEVKKITNKRFAGGGQIQYKVKWKGYKNETWEPAENLKCEDLIDSFEESLKRHLNRRSVTREHSAARATPARATPARATPVRSTPMTKQEPVQAKRMRLMKEDEMAAKTPSPAPLTKKKLATMDSGNSSKKTPLSAVASLARSNSTNRSSTPNRGAEKSAAKVASTSSRMVGESPLLHTSHISKSKPAKRSIEILSVKRGSSGPVARVLYPDNTEKLIDTAVLAVDEHQKLLAFYEQYLNLKP